MRKNTHPTRTARGVVLTREERADVEAAARAEGIAPFVARAMVSMATYYRAVGGGGVYPVFRAALLSAARNSSAVDSACAGKNAAA